MAQREPSIVFGVFKGMGDLLWATPALQAELERGVSVHLLLLPGPALRELITLIDFGPHRDNLHLHTLPTDLKAWPHFLDEMRALSPGIIWISPHAPRADASWKIPLLLRTLQHLFWRRARLIGAQSEPLSTLLQQRIPVDRTLALKRREWSAYRLLRGPSLPEETPTPRFDRVILDRCNAAPLYDLVIHPGASAKNRIWPTHNYPSLLGLLPPEWKIAVLGLPEDVAALRQLIPADRSIDYRTGTLRESLLTLASARTALVMDSSAMHFADVLGIPAVAIFLKDDPATVIDLNSCIQPIYCLDTVDPAAVAKQIQATWARSNPINIPPAAL